MTATDRAVYRWASQRWPDLAATWTSHAAYYRRQFALSLARGTATETVES